MSPILYNPHRLIDGFLRDHPHGHLYVTVGFASSWGLAWLHERTRRRRVTLIIGNINLPRFRRAAQSSRHEALAFLRRRNVEVLNWYRTAQNPRGSAKLGANCWMVAQEGKPLAALVGSANLNKPCLEDNWEMMVKVTESELSRIWAQLDRFYRKGDGKTPPWDVKERLADAIASDQQPSPKKTKPPQHPEPKRAGCLSAVAGWSLAIIVAVSILMTLGN